MQLVAGVSPAQTLESREHLRINDASNTSMKDSDSKKLRAWTFA